MPHGDRTGPYGEGPGSGRGLGYCNGYNTPGYMNQQAGFRGAGFGRGFGHGYGRGFGRGWSQGYYGTPYPDVSEKTFVENEVRLLQDQLENLEKRLKEMKDTDSSIL